MRVRCTGAPRCLTPQNNPVAGLWGSKSLWSCSYQHSRRDKLRGQSSLDWGLDWGLGRGLSEGLGLDLDEVSLHAMKGNRLQQVLSYEGRGLNAGLLGENQEFHFLHLDELMMKRSGPCGLGLCGGTRLRTVLERSAQCGGSCSRD